MSTPPYDRRFQDLHRYATLARQRSRRCSTRVIDDISKIEPCVGKPGDSLESNHRHGRKRDVSRIERCGRGRPSSKRIEKYRYSTRRRQRARGNTFITCDDHNYISRSEAGHDVHCLTTETAWRPSRTACRRAVLAERRACQRFWKDMASVSGLTTSAVSEQLHVYEEQTIALRRGRRHV
ncbi:hypothetical protein MRX96_028638 [Rhipicephalus microplus]